MFYFVNDGVPMFKSDMLDFVPHGFSTRLGGVSRGVTESMNLAFGRGDTDETVVENFEIFAHAIGANPENGIMLHQIHSRDVMVCDESTFGLGVYKKTDMELDGYVSCTKGALLCVRVADCVPILFADRLKRVIGAVHSGWRGSVLKISQECINKMVSLGAARENIVAAIGPCICKDCYEVGEDFVNACKDFLDVDTCEKFIEKDKCGKNHADLKLLNKLVLLGCGIKEENIDVCGRCTCCEPNLFFSHRYHNNARGTMGAMIALEDKN